MSEDRQPTFEGIEDAVATLERLDLCALADDPVAMAEAMIVRQHALDYLKSHPLSAVPEERRGALRQRLEDVQTGDARALELLREASVQVAEQLDNMVSGRAAVRGYGGLSSADSTLPPGVKRMG
jgi:hypothetical protein